LAEAGGVTLPLAMAFAIANGVKAEQGTVTATVAGSLILALSSDAHVTITPPAAHTAAPRADPA
jgi:MFS superfamily sulfate permease-like transporter